MQCASDKSNVGERLTGLRVKISSDKVMTKFRMMTECSREDGEMGGNSKKLSDKGHTKGAFIY